MSRTRVLVLLVACLILPVSLQSRNVLRGARGKPASREAGPKPLGGGEPFPEGALARLGTTRLWHPNPVLQLAFIPDGLSLASLGGDGFRLWTIASGQERSGFGWRLSQQGYARAFSRDGKFLAVEGEDHSLHLWDLARRKKLWTAGPTEGADYTFLRFSDDGKLLAADQGDVIRLWTVATGKERRRLSWTGRTVAAFAFSPDGSRLAGAIDSRIRVWDTATGKKMRTYEGHQTDIRCLAFAPDGKTLASASKTIRLWELATEEELRKIPVAESDTVVLTFAPDGKTLASAGEDNLVRLWDAATGKELRQFVGDNGEVHCLAFSPDGKTLASGSDGGLIRLWKTATGKELLPFRRAPRIVSASLSEDGKTAILGGPEGAIDHWDVARGKQLRCYVAPPGKPTAMAFSPDGKRVALVEKEGGILLWDADRGKELRRWAGHEGGAACLAFAPDGATLASAGQDRSVRLWQVASGQEQHQMNIPSADPARVNKPAVDERDNTPRTLAFSADGRMLATVTEENQVFLWETATGKERSRFRGLSGGEGTATFSPDGRLLAVGGDDAIVRLWDVASGKLRRVCLGHEGAVHAVSFSPDGKRLASGSEDTTVRLWDVASARELRCFRGHQAEVRALAFFADGKKLLSGSIDTTALIWDLSTPPKAKPARGGVQTPALARLWSDLARLDASVSFRALVAMADRPKETVPFLEQQLKPVSPADPRLITKLLASLDDPRFAIRSQSARQLEELGGRAVAPVRQALAAKPSLEVSKRLQLILKKLEGPVTSPTTLREMRAVEVLERAGTSEAARVLQRLARGASEAQLTSDAQQALRRLTRRQAVKP